MLCCLIIHLTSRQVSEIPPANVPIELATVAWAAIADVARAVDPTLVTTGAIADAAPTAPALAATVPALTAIPAPRLPPISTRDAAGMTQFAPCTKENEPSVCGNFNL